MYKALLHSRKEKEQVQSCIQVRKVKDYLETRKEYTYKKVKINELENILKGMDVEFLYEHTKILQRSCKIKNYTVRKQEREFNKWRLDI